MTTNREQHEQAAKAAGLTITWKEGHCKGGPFEGAFIGDQPWRPKEDDGDALRLAVKLGICTLIDLNCVGQTDAWEFQRKCDSAVVNHKEDPCAATRLAIFRAAVEIGKAMP